MSQPPIDVLGGPEQTPALARIANDGMAAKSAARTRTASPSFLLSLPINNPRRSGEGGRPRCLRARRVRRPDPFQRQRPRARRSGVLPGVRAAGTPRQTGFPASSAADGSCRLPGRGRVEIRDFLGPRLGLTRPPRRWLVSCSPACSTSSRTSRCSRTTGAPTFPTPKAGCRTGKAGRRNRTRPITAPSRTISNVR